MTTFIGTWQAARILTGGQGDASDIEAANLMLAAFRFLLMAAANSMCEAVGRRGSNTAPEKIPAQAWLYLTLDPIASTPLGDGNAEYAAVTAHPRTSGPDYHQNTWSNLYWRSDEIERAQRDFRRWIDAGRPEEIPPATQEEIAAAEPLNQCISLLHKLKSNGKAARKVVEPMAMEAIEGLTTRDFDAAYKRVHGYSRGRPKKINPQKSPI